jgi:hypothetical protein
MKPTKSFQEPVPGRRFAPLVTSATVEDVADSCRSAALGFAWGAHRGWGRLELARWLTGPYAQALAWTRHLRGSGSGLRRAAPRGPLEERTIRDLLVRTHAQLVTGLRRCWSWADDPTFAGDLLDAGLIVGVADDHGGIGYAPCPVWDLQLLDRVRSLYIADYLTRPHDYARFGVCDGCEAVTFDWTGLHDDCSTSFRTPTPSRSVFRRRAVTLVGLPMQPPFDASAQRDAARAG